MGQQPSGLTPTGRAEPNPDQPQIHQKDPEGWIAGAAYSTGYGISFGVVFSTLLVASFFPTDNALGRGLRDGASAASRSSQAARLRLDALASTTRTKAEGAYARVAGGVMERVEAVQDQIAERQHRRRLASDVM